MMIANLLALVVLLQAMVTGPLLDNDYVRVFKNSAPCATGEASCGERVLVALGPLEVNGQKLQRGEIKVFAPGERYHAPKAGSFLEVAVKPTHPKVTPPAA